MPRPEQISEAHITLSSSERFSCYDIYTFLFCSGGRGIELSRLAFLGNK